MCINWILDEHLMNTVETLLSVPLLLPTLLDKKGIFTHSPLLGILSPLIFIIMLLILFNLFDICVQFLLKQKGDTEDKYKGSVFACVCYVSNWLPFCVHRSRGLEPLL